MLSDYLASYSPLNTITIAKNAIINNYVTMKKIANKPFIIPVLKSNAYGHGLKAVCKILSQSEYFDSPLIAVDSYPEYQIVRDYTKKDILIMGEIPYELLGSIGTDRIHISINSILYLKKIISLEQKLSIHLFCNTGMNREGIAYSQCEETIELLSQNKNIETKGIMSHLAYADCVDSSFNEQQRLSFERFVQYFKKNDICPEYIHLANSAGSAKIEDNICSTTRCGVSLFGISPLEDLDRYNIKYDTLQPAMEVYSTVIATQQVQKGDIVSYSGTFVSQKNTRIATIAFGYNEGLRRSGSNKYIFQRKGKPIKQVGNVCMNLCSLDCGEFDIQPGDLIQVVSPIRSDPNSLYQHAKYTNTIPYEIMVGLDSGLRRSIV